MQIGYFGRSLVASAALICFCSPLLGQDDSTTQNGGSAYGGGFITGPASNPLSFLNGSAYRTFGQNTPYDVPSFAPVTSATDALPPWLSVGWEERVRVEGYENGSFKRGNNASETLLRSRVMLTVSPRRWFRVVSQLQDARPFFERPPIGPPNLNAWDLKLAYAEVGDLETGGITLRAGRQLLNFNNTILANSEWRNQARSYDGAVGYLHRGRYRVALFAASVVVPQAEGPSDHQNGSAVSGAYGRIDDPLPASLLEPFIIYRLQPLATILGSIKGPESERAYGVRFKGFAAHSLDYSAELILERGTVGTEPIRAWATSDGLGWRFDRVVAKPRFFWQYDYASGQRPGDTGVHATFDTMYPTAHDRFGITDQFGWQNIISQRVGMTIEPRHRFTLTVQYLDLWLASRTDAVYNSSGDALVRDARGTSGTHIGQEYDAYTWYELNRNMNIGAGLGHFETGGFLQATTKAPGFLYPYFAINFKDNPAPRR